MKNMIKTKKKLAITAMAVFMLLVGGVIIAKLLGVSFAENNVGQGDTVKVGNGKYKIISEYDSFAQYVGPTKRSVKTVTIPDTIKAGGKTYKVVSIGDEAFSYSCNTLKKVTIGKNVVGIGEMAFRYCKKLKTITIKTTHLTIENVKPGAFYKMYDKVVITVPKQKLTEYKKILKAKNVGVTGKKQKIKGKAMTGEDGFTNTVYDPDAKVPTPEVAMGLDTAIDFRKMQTKEAEYSVGDTIPIAMKVKMPQELFGYWDLYMIDKGKTYLECGVCGRMFEPYHKSFSFENFWLHTYIPINDNCDCTVNNNIFGPSKHTFLAWRKVFYKTPCKAVFKITLPDGIDYHEGSIKVHQVRMLNLDEYNGSITQVKEDLYQTEVSGKEITVTVDNIKTFIPDANYHIYVEFEAKLNNEASDVNDVEATLAYNDKEGNKEVAFNKVTVLNP